MIIYYPTYYLVPVKPVMFSFEDEYNTRHNAEDYDENSTVHSKNNIKASEIANVYRTINEDIFNKVDEEYVNASIK